MRGNSCSMRAASLQGAALCPSVIRPRTACRPKSRDIQQQDGVRAHANPPESGLWSLVHGAQQKVDDMLHVLQPPRFETQAAVQSQISQGAPPAQPSFPAFLDSRTLSTLKSSTAQLSGPPQPTTIHQVSQAPPDISDTSPPLSTAKAASAELKSLISQLSAASSRAEASADLAGTSQRLGFSSAKAASAELESLISQLSAASPGAEASAELAGSSQRLSTQPAELYQTWQSSGIPSSSTHLSSASASSSALSGIMSDLSASWAAGNTTDAEAQALDEATRQLLRAASAPSLQSQQDMVEAAERLQQFVLHYRGQYGGAVGARIDQTAAKLQAFIDAYRPPASGLWAVQVLEGQYQGTGPIEAALVAPVTGAAPQPEFQNYLWEGVLAALQWIQDLILPDGAPAPLGREGAGVGQSQQLLDAAERLRNLSEQLKEAHTMYSLTDPEERASLSSLLQQLSDIANRVALSGSRLPTSNPTAMDKANQPMGGPNDPLLGLLEGLYRAVVVDSGLRDFLVGIRRLGDSIVGGMEVGWHAVPPVARLAAYAAALAGALFLLRTRVPASLSGREPTGLPPPDEPSARGQPPISSLASADRHWSSTSDAGVTLVQGSYTSAELTSAAGRDLAVPPGTSSYGTGANRIRAAGSATRGQINLVPTEELVAAGARASPNSVQMAWNAFRESLKASASTSGALMAPYRSPTQASSTSVQAPPTSGVSTTALPAAPSEPGAAWSPAAPSSLGYSAPSAGARQSHAAGSGYDPPAGSRTTPLGRAGSRGALVSGQGVGASPSATGNMAGVRRDTKQRLVQATLALGPVMAVVPGGEPVREEVDRLLMQLEQLDPNPGSGQDCVQGQWPGHTASENVLGTWTLSYASSGAPPVVSDSPNVFAQALQMADSIPGLGMDAITHQLTPDPINPNTAWMVNSTVFRFGPLGSWRVAVSGNWRDLPDGSSDVAFHSFSVQPVQLLGMPVQGLPEVSVPIPELLQSHMTWLTTYADGDIRVNRCAGAILMFRRSDVADASPWSEAAMAQPSPDAVAGLSWGPDGRTAPGLARSPPSRRF